MNREECAFIRILSDHLSQIDTNICEELEWSAISDYAHMHQVEGIIYFQCRNLMPEDIRAKLEQAFYATVYDFSNRKQVMGVVANRLKSEDIFFITVKGLKVAEYYPKPSLRTMGDCDMVVHRADVPDVIRLLQSLGFSGDKSVSLQQWGGDLRGIHFELHDRLIQEGEYATVGQTTFFNAYDRYVKEDSLDVNFHFLYLLMHLRKHFLNHGVGIRQFMDLATMVRNEHSLDWNWIEEYVRILELHEFAHVCYALINNWFHVRVPVDYNELTREDYEQITRKILKNGVFGFDDPDNRNANAYTALLKTSGPMWMRRISILLRNTFISYEIMRGYEGCEFVDGRPWLMPLAWSKRLFSIINRKDKSNTVNVIKNSFIADSSLNERRKMLKMMGLL